MNTNKSTAKTLSEQYAAKRGKGIVTQAMATQYVAIGFTAAIVIAAMVANFGKQYGFLTQHTDHLESALAPISLDLLTVMCGAVLALPVASKGTKWVMLIGLVFGVGCSSTLSAIAPGDGIAKCVAGGMVALIAVAEFMANHIHIDFKLLQAAETENAPQAKTRKVKTLAEKQAIADKARATRQANALTRMQAGYVPSNAPVSPAIA